MKIILLCLLVLVINDNAFSSSRYGYQERKELSLDEKEIALVREKITGNIDKYTEDKSLIKSISKIIGALTKEEIKNEVDNRGEKHSNLDELKKKLKNIRNIVFQLTELSPDVLEKFEQNLPKLVAQLDVIATAPIATVSPKNKANSVVGAMASTDNINKVTNKLTAGLGGLLGGFGAPAAQGG